MNRVIEPELLDRLPPDHPEALRSRRDLLLINRLMGNFRWFRRRLPALLLPGDRILELGAGTGQMALALFGARQRSLPAYAGIDLLPRPEAWPAAWQWHQGCVHSYSGFGDYSVIIANLFLHHFTPAQLLDLGKRFTGARLILACEPARRRIHQGQVRLLGLTGLSAVTRHDAGVSIAAGFLGRELPDLLGLEMPLWTAACSSGLLGQYRMIAKRNGAAPPVPS